MGITSFPLPSLPSYLFPSLPLPLPPPQKQDRYKAIQALVDHLDAKSSKSCDLKQGILDTLSRCVAVAADGSLGKLDSSKVLFWFEQEQTEATWKAPKVICFSHYLMFPGSGMKLTPQFGNEVIPSVWE